jgi:superfamily II DNA/RNA helicase
LRRGEGPIVLIVAPTRELARQIEQEAKQFATRGIRMCCVYGGVLVFEDKFKNLNFEMVLKSLFVPQEEC